MSEPLSVEELIADLEVLGRDRKGQPWVSSVARDAIRALRDKDARIASLESSLARAREDMLARQAMLNIYARKYGRDPERGTYVVPIFTRAEIEEEVEKIR